jgi:hypothetical protein
MPLSLERLPGPYRVKSKSTPTKAFASLDYDITDCKVLYKKT